MSLFKSLSCPHCGASLNWFPDAKVCPRCEKDLQPVDDPFLKAVGVLVQTGLTRLHPAVNSGLSGQGENAAKAEPNFSVQPAPSSPALEIGGMEGARMNWFYLVGGKPQGPLPTDELRSALSAGELGQGVYVFRDGLPGWKQAQDCAELCPPQPTRISILADPKPEVQAPGPLRFLVKAQEEVRGPFTLEELKSEVMSMRISLSDLGKKEGASEWVALKDMPEVLDQILPPLPETTPAANIPSAQAPSVVIASALTPSAGATQGPSQNGTENRSQPPALISEPPSTASAIPFAASAAAVLATRRSRLFAQLGEFVILFVLGALFGGIASLLGNTSVVGLAIILLELFWLVGNSVLLARRGQTVGKMVFGIKIVDFKTGHTGGARVVLLRYLLLCLLSFLSPLGGIFLIVFFLVFTIDSLCIFRKDRRCLHDFLANTVVVQSKAPYVIGQANGQFP